MLSILKELYAKKGHDGFARRLEIMEEFMKESGLSKTNEIDTPLNIVWSISSAYNQAIKYQMGQIFQHVSFNPEDILLIVCDYNREEHVWAIYKELLDDKELPIRIDCVSVDRKDLGDTPFLNWEIGLQHPAFTDPNRRFLFLRDNTLFFNPVRLFSEARNTDVDHKLVNFSSILGVHISEHMSDWLWAVHSKWAPTPVLNAFVALKKNLLAINGFDVKFKKGFGYFGDLDTILRWTKYGLDYVINDSARILRFPLFVDTEEQKQRVDLQSLTMLAYLRDKYGRDIREELKPPLRMNLALINVMDAMTYDPFSRIDWSNYKQELPKIDKDIFNFIKPNLADLIKED